jgi:hypothetical protein
VTSGPVRSRHARSAPSGRRAPVINSDGAKEIGSYWTDIIHRDLVSTDVDFDDQWY